MTDIDPIIRNALDVLSPEENEPPEWRSIVAHAQVNGTRTADPAVMPRLQPVPRKRNRRRSLVLLAALLVLLAILFAVPALGLRDKLISLFESGEPAPTRVVADFQQMDVGAPEGMAPGVSFEDARLVYEHWVTAKLKALVYAAPAKNGGFCEAVAFKKRGGRTRDWTAGCLPSPSDRPAIGTTTGGFTTREPFFIAGSVSAPEAATLVLAFEDGKRQTLPLTWVSEPIDAAFFAFAVVPYRPKPGHRPSALIALDASGNEVARDEQSLEASFTESFGLPCGGTLVPCDAIRAKRRPLISITTEKGNNATLWVAPSTKGGLCSWLRHGKHGSFGGGCRSPSVQLPADQIAAGRSQGAGKGREVVLLWGQVGANVASLLLRYQDGERVTLIPAEGFVLYEIPSRHYRIGHRLQLILGRNRAGEIIARQSLSTNSPGSYPCSKPKKLATLVNGKSVYACP